MLGPCVPPAPGTRVVVPAPFVARRWAAVLEPTLPRTPVPLFVPADFKRFAKIRRVASPAAVVLAGVPAAPAQAGRESATIASAHAAARNGGAAPMRAVTP
jgi:hypothetical protein